MKNAHSLPSLPPRPGIAMTTGNKHSEEEEETAGACICTSSSLPQSHTADEEQRFPESTNAAQDVNTVPFARSRTLQRIKELQPGTKKQKQSLRVIHLDAGE